MKSVYSAVRTGPLNKAVFHCLVRFNATQVLPYSPKEIKGKEM